MGPDAGISLARQVHDATIVSTEQDHLDLILASFPSRTPDRSAYLLGEESISPAGGILEAIESCCAAGARVLGIACNTAHAPRIFGPIQTAVSARHPDVRLESMVDSVVATVAEDYALQCVGVLATTGTISVDVYGPALRRRGLRVLYPELPGEQDEVHAAIYDPEFGIKVLGTRVSPESRGRLLAAGRGLIDRGAQALILACTELGLALTGESLDGAPLIDSSRCLARALVRHVAPDQLARCAPGAALTSCPRARLFPSASR
jgi:aspartate racemase